MRSFTDNEILSRVEHLPSFKGWRHAAYSIWVRSAADQFNLFDDKNFIYSGEADGERPKFVMARPGTTNAGAYYLEHFDQYNSLGCAVLCSDVIVDDSHIKGFHHHNPNNPAYVENPAHPFPYHRDPNKNHRAEEIGPVYHDAIGANDHHAGLHSIYIENWSAGCLVTSVLSIYQQFLRFMESKGYPPLSTAILREENI